MIPRCSRWATRSASEVLVDGDEVERLALERGGVGHGAQGQDAGQRDADPDRDDEVEGDGRHGGREEEEDGVAAAGAQDAGGGAQLDHPHGGDHEDAGERGERYGCHERRQGDDHDDEHDAVEDRRHPGAGAGANVHGGAGDRAGRRHPAEERHGDVGQSLADELPVAVGS